MLVIADINPDILVSGVGELTFGQKEDLVQATRLTVGGSGCITAAGLARLGTEVGVAGVVGDDLFGRFMLDELSARGVATERVRVIPGGRTASSVILSERAGTRERHILTDPGVMGRLRASDVDLDSVPRPRHLHVSSWFLHGGATRGFAGLLARSRERDMTVSVDPNDDPDDRWDAHLPACLEHIDLLFCTEREAVALADRPGSTPLEAADRLLAALAPGPSSTVVLKRGAEGAVAVSRQGIHSASAPRVETVDAVGAGDTLAAAFLHAFLRGDPITDSLRLGVAAASLSTRFAGGVDAQPDPDEAHRVADSLELSSSRWVPAPTIPGESPRMAAEPTPSARTDRSTA